MTENRPSLERVRQDTLFRLRFWSACVCTVLWHNGAMRLAILCLCALSAWAADVMPPEAEQRLAREIYKEMVEVKSGFTTGSTTPIAESVAARFKEAGFPTLGVPPTS